MTPAKLNAAKLNAAELIVRWRWCLFLFAVISLAFAWPASNRLALDRSLQKMFATDDPIRVSFEKLVEQFGVSDLVVVAYRDPDLWNQDGSGLRRLQRVHERIEQTAGVASVMDLTRVDELLSQMNTVSSVLPGLFGSKKDNNPKELTKHPVLDPNNELATQFKQLFEGQTHSANGQLVALGCVLEPENRAKQPLATTITKLRSIANEATQSTDHFRNQSGVTQTVGGGLIVGQPVMVQEGFEEIERDGVRLGYFSTISLAMLLLIGFRSLRWTLITIAVVQWSLVITRALLVWIAWDLTMVSSMLSSIVTVIGVATTMHWMLGYQRELEMISSSAESLAHGGVTSDDAVEAMKRSARGLLWPIAWACITDAIGFAALSFARVGPVQDYGCMMALASMVVLLGIVAIIPCMAILPLPLNQRFRWPGMSYSLQHVPGDTIIQRGLLRILDFTTRHAWGLIIIFTAVWVWAFIGSLYLKVETDFIKNFRQDAPISVDYRTIENELGGAGVWDVVVPAPKPLSQSYLNAILELEDDLRSLTIADPTQAQQSVTLTKVMSIADADAIGAKKGLVAQMPPEARLFAMKQAMGNFFDTLVSERPSNRESKSTERFFRIMLRSREQSETELKQQLIHSVKACVAETVRSENWQKNFSGANEHSTNAFVSGYYVLLSQLVSSVVADQWLCFGVATTGILIAMAIALRSVKLSIIAIVPNMIPSLLILGWMGWTGMRMNLGAAMIAAVSMGLSVDSSMHFLYRYRSLVGSGESPSVALEGTQSETGLSVFLSTLALVIGFSSLATSDFLPTIVFGVTSALTMLGGLVGNLVLLPALIKKFA